MAFKIAALSRIDAYPRAESHLTQRTASGAASESIVCFG